MRIPYDAIISVSSSPSYTYQRCISFTSKFFVSSNREIPRAGDVIEADFGNEYVNAYVTDVTFNSFSSQVELSAQIVESYPTPNTPPFSFDPSILKQ